MEGPEVHIPANDVFSAGARLSHWRKRVGDQVTKGEPLAEIELNKALVELKAPWSGVLLRRSLPAGTPVSAGTVIALLEPSEHGPLSPEAIPSDHPSRTHHPWFLVLRFLEVGLAGGGFLCLVVGAWGFFAAKQRFPPVLLGAGGIALACYISLHPVLWWVRHRQAPRRQASEPWSRLEDLVQVLEDECLAGMCMSGAFALAAASQGLSGGGHPSLWLYFEMFGIGGFFLTGALGWFLRRRKQRLLDQDLPPPSRESP